MDGEMNKFRTLIPTVRSVMMAILSVFLVLFSLLSILSVVFRSAIVDEENYRKAVQTPSFSEKMKGYMREELESECLFYDLPFSVLDEALVAENIDAFVVRYAEELYSALLNGTAIAISDWDSQPFVDAVQHFFDTLPLEEKPFDPNAAQTVGTELSDYTVFLLKGGIRESFLKMGYKIFSHPLIVKLIEKLTFFFWMAIVCVLGILLCSWSDWRKGGYIISFMLGISSFLALVPFWLLDRYSLMERISLADSPFKLYVESIFNSILHEAITITATCFLVTTGLFLLSIVLRSFSSHKT